MSNFEPRLKSCFLAVFPDLAEADIPRASQASLTEWDSTAHVTLLVTVSEEFQIDLDDRVFESLVSYPLILKFVESRAHA